MVTIGAGGMESDITDSDCEMVFADSDNKIPKKRDPDLEFVAVDREKVLNGSFKPILKNGREHNGFASQPRSNQNSYHNARYRDKHSKHPVCKNSQPLDDLRYAVMAGNFEVTKAILAKGIYVDSILRAGWTALMYASSCAQHEIVLYLLENKADPNYHKDSFTALMAACASSKNEADLHKCCCHLLKYGAKVNVHERHLTTPLMFASREGHYQIVKELLEAGADVNEQDSKSQTALFWAASKGHGQIVHLLLSKEADLSIVDISGQTVSDLAYSHGFTELAAVLERSASKQNVNSADFLTKEHEQQSKMTKELLGNIHSENQAAKRTRLNQKYCEKQGELEVFLSGLNLADLISTFNEHHLTFADLLIINEKELEKIGITQLGVRTKILEALKAVHKEKWQNSSLQSLKQLQYISCPDAVAMMANIAKHLRYISTSVVYVRQQIQSEPRILELAQDTANVYDLIDEMNDSLKNLQNLNDELRFFKLHLNKVQDNVKYHPADVIVESPPDKQAVTRIVVFWSVTVSMIVGGILWKKPNTLQYLGSLVISKIPFLKR